MCVSGAPHYVPFVSPRVCCDCTSRQQLKTSPPLQGSLGHHFITSCRHFSLFSAALWDLTNCRSVHSLFLSSYLFFCPPCLLPPFTVPCKMVLARSDERETNPYHISLRLFTMVRRCSCGLIACWILAQTSPLVAWSLYEIRGILR